MTSVASPARLEESLNRVRGVRAAVFGDFRVEASWYLGDGGSERTTPVTAQAYGLGEAGRIAANLADLGAQAVHAVGLIGDDMFGHQLVHLLHRRGINTDSLIRLEGPWSTSVRARCLSASGEQEVLEFGPSGGPDAAALRRLTDALDRVAGWCDVVVLRASGPLAGPPAELRQQITSLAGGRRSGRFVVATDGAEDVCSGAATVTTDPAAGAGDGDVDRHELLRDLYARSRQPSFLVADDRLLACDGTALHETRTADLLNEPAGGADAWAATAAVAALRGASMDSVACSRLAVVASHVAASVPASPTPTASAEAIRQFMGPH